jgi:hypothetical protein
MAEKRPRDVGGTLRKLGVTKRIWEIGDIVDVLEAWENTT